MFLSACLVAVLPAADPGPHTVALAPTADGKLLFVALSNGPGSKDAAGWVCVWDLSKPELKTVITGLPADVRTVQPTADGKRFVLVGGNNWRVTHLAVWDTATKKLRDTFDVSPKDPGLAAVSADGNWVAYRPAREKAEIRVWNAVTGERVEAVEKSIGMTEGALAFSPDSKQLVVTSQRCDAFDLGTGKRVEWWRSVEPAVQFIEYGTPAVLVGGKGVVTVAGTGKRRQSYVVRIVTEKRSWYLGQFWDFATAPILSPDGRWLLVSGIGRTTETGTFVLKFDENGNPELEAPPEKPVGPSVYADGMKVPAWREWVIGAAARTGHAYPGAMAFASDGARLFASSSQGKIQVHDTATREPRATLFVTAPNKDEVPDWSVLTTTGEFVGSASEAESLKRAGKVADPAKVKAALGVK